MKLHKLLLLGVVAAFGTALYGCDTNDGPAEEMGESLDNAGENIEDAAADARNAAEDACEEAKDGVGAEDKDC